MKKISWIGFIGSVLIAIGLINWLTWFYLNFNIVEWMTFGIRWLAGVVYTIVGILGLIGLGELLYRTFK